MSTSSDRVMPELIPRSILQVVSALGAAQKLKNISLGLRLQRRRQQDSGNFDITHCDEPYGYQEELDYGFLRAKQSSKATSSLSTESSTGTTCKAPIQNTYQLEPSRKFEERKVREVIKTTFEEHLAGQSYSPEFSNEKSRILAECIKQKVKALQFSRYKIICVVNICQKQGQAVRLVSRCVWDSEHDDFAQHSMESEDLYATGIVFGVYQE